MIVLLVPPLEENVYTVYYTLNYGLYLVGYEDNIMHIYKVSPRLLFGLEMRLNLFFTLSIR